MENEILKLNLIMNKMLYEQHFLSDDEYDDIQKKILSKLGDNYEHKKIS